MTKRLAIGVLIGCCLAGCGGERDSPEAIADRHPQPVTVVMEDGRPAPSVLAAEQVIHRGNGEEPTTLDPHRAEGVPANNILRDLFEGLVTEAPDGTLIPGVAERWNISRDGLTYTFYLRRDAQWSNGDPLTAADFVYSLRRVVAPETASDYAQVLTPVIGAEDIIAGRVAVDTLAIEPLDEFTLQITLNAPTPYFLSVLTLSAAYPVHRPSVEAHGALFSRPGNLVSNGAFVLDEWAVRSHIDLRRNPRYWNVESVIPEHVRYYPIEDHGAELKQFRAGNLHWTYEVPSNQFEWLQQNYPEQLHVSPWLGSYYFGFNLTRPPFQDEPVLRRALSMAIDRELLTEKVTQFGEIPAWTVVPPGIPGYEPFRPDWADWTQAEREEEARRLYQRAGFTRDEPLRTEIRYNSSQNHKKVALAVAAMWKQVLGVEATLVNEEWRVFLQNRRQRAVTEIFRAGWISDYSDPYSFLELFRASNSQNDTGYSNRRYDRLLDEIAEERIPGRRARLMAEAERTLMSDWPIVPVYSYVTKRLVDRRLQGWESNPLDHHYSRSMYLVKSRDAADGPAP